MKLKKPFLIISLFFIFNLIVWNYFVIDNKEKCWNDIDFKKVEQLLLISPIKKKISIKSYNGEKPDVFLLFFKNGMKAIFKPERDIMEQASALRGYQLSQVLNFKLIPPTVIRTINGERGMVRFFVEGIPGDRYNLRDLKSFEKNAIYSFYFILGEIDHAEKDIVIGKNCNRPALFDSDENMMLFSFIQYGDFPFFRYSIPSLPVIDLNVSDYKQFPFDKVKTVEQISTIEPKKIQNIFSYMPFDFIEELTDSFDYPVVDDTLYYVRWKNALWIKLNLNDVNYIYKDFIPSFFSKKTIRSLKNLNQSNLNSLSSTIETYFDDKETKIILKRLIQSNNLILYKKDLLLEQFKKRL